MGCEPTTQGLQTGLPYYSPPPVRYAVGSVDAEAPRSARMSPLRRDRNAVDNMYSISSVVAKLRKDDFSKMKLAGITNKMGRRTKITRRPQSGKNEVVRRACTARWDFPFMQVLYGTQLILYPGLSSQD